MSDLQRTERAGTLESLATEINEEHRAFVGSLRKTAEHGIRAGELLAEAKGQCRHGEWLGWLQKNFEGSTRTAQVYMQLSHKRDELRAKTQNSAHLSMSRALKEISAPQEEPSSSNASASQINGGSAPTALIMDGDLARFMVEADRPFPGEARKMEEDLVAGRWRPTLVVWRAERMLLAGYNVYPIYVKHGIPFDVEQKDFETELDAVMWSIGRRMLWSMLLPFILEESERKKVFGSSLSNPREYVGKMESWARGMLKRDGGREGHNSALSRVVAEDVVRDLPVWGVDNMMVELGRFESERRDK